MARANANALKTLAAGKYMLIATAATQRTGAQPDANTGEPSVYVNVRFETKERQYVYQNYSLNNPIYYLESAATRPDNLLFDPRRIDFGDDVVLTDILTFGESEAQQPAIDLRAHGHGV